MILVSYKLFILYLKFKLLPLSIIQINNAIIAIFIQLFSRGLLTRADFELEAEQIETEI